MGAKLDELQLVKAVGNSQAVEKREIGLYH